METIKLKVGPTRQIEPCITNIVEDRSEKLKEILEGLKLTGIIDEKIAMQMCPFWFYNSNPNAFHYVFDSDDFKDLNRLDLNRIKSVSVHSHLDTVTTLIMDIYSFDKKYKEAIKEFVFTGLTYISTPLAYNFKVNSNRISKDKRYVIPLFMVPFYTYFFCTKDQFISNFIVINQIMENSIKNEKSENPQFVSEYMQFYANYYMTIDFLGKIQIFEQSSQTDDFIKRLIVFNKYMEIEKKKRESNIEVIPTKKIKSEKRPLKNE